MSEQADTPTLGRYRLLRQIGEGGMGEVYLASAQGTAGFEKLVALKVLGDIYSGDRGRLDSLKREALIGVKLDHEHIVEILDFGEADGTHFIAMEFVRGHGLDRVLRYGNSAEHPTPLRAASHIVRAVARALGYIHRVKDAEGLPLGLVHSDVSPSNILLGIDGRIKLADFGVAGLAREIEQAWMVVGKPRYLPPEALAGELPRQAWDVYALGCVLYEAVTGQTAVEGEHIDELRAAHAAGIVPAAELRPDCPPLLAQLLGRALHVDATERFPSADAFRAALDEAVPPRVADLDAHQEWVKALFEAEDFVAQYGDLPVTGGFGQTGDLAPYIASRSRTLTVAQKRQPALRFGLTPALSTDVAREYGARFAKILSDQTARPVRTIVFADYRTLVDCLCQGEVDFAWMPPLSYLEAAKRGARPLVVATRYGRPTFESAVIVRADAKVESFADLRDQPMAWVDPKSASGYLFAYAEILAAIDGGALGREHFHGSHQAVCEAVANGWAVGGATYAVRDEAGDVVVGGWSQLLPERSDELRALGYAGPIPADTIAQRPRFGHRDREVLIRALTGFSAHAAGQILLREVFNAESFTVGEDDLYRPVADALAAVAAAKQGGEGE